jgi:hypothetical protein
MNEPLWWTIVSTITAIIAASIVALRAWQYRRWVAIFCLIFLAAANFSTIVLTVRFPSHARELFFTLAALQLLIVVVLYLTKILTGTVKENLAAVILGVGLVGIVAMATRAHDGAWDPASSRAAFYILLGSAALACYVGQPIYHSMVVQERTQDPRQGAHLVLLSMLPGLGVISASIPVFLLLGEALGFQEPSFGPQSPSSWARAQILAVLASIALAAVAVARLAQPVKVHDDRMRIQPIAYGIVFMSMVSATVAITHDIALHPPEIWMWLRIYYVVPCTLAGCLYAEDIVATPVRLQVLIPEWPARILATLGGILVAIASYWTVTTRIWAHGTHLASISATAGALGTLLIVLVIVAASVYVLAFASDPVRQQLTAKSAASNTLQGQLLYLGLLYSALFVPIETLGRLTRNILTDLPLIAAFCAFMLILWRLYRFTSQQNSEHLASEAKREIPQITWRVKDQKASQALKNEFLVRLKAHVRWQDQAGGILLVVSLVGAGAYIRKAMESVGAETGPRTS